MTSGKIVKIKPTEESVNELIDLNIKLGFCDSTPEAIEKLRKLYSQEFEVLIK